MFTRAEAERIATRWVRQGQPERDRWQVGFREFDRGYLVWPLPPQDEPAPIGMARGIIDKDTGELSVWPSLPLDEVLQLYRDDRARRIPAPRTWDPVARSRRDLSRATFPEHVTHLTLADGRLQISRSMKGDGEPNIHPLVRDLLDSVPADARERGYRRCSEVAALSDALHTADAGRAADHRPPLTLEQARSELFRGAGIVTYRVREPADPLAGQPGPPCLSCYLLLAHFGFSLQAPAGTGAA